MFPRRSRRVSNSLMKSNHIRKYHLSFRSNKKSSQESVVIHKKHWCHKRGEYSFLKTIKAQEVLPEQLDADTYETEPLFFGYSNGKVHSWWFRTWTIGCCSSYIDTRSWGTNSYDRIWPDGMIHAWVGQKRYGSYTSLVSLSGQFTITHMERGGTFVQNYHTR